MFAREALDNGKDIHHCSARRNALHTARKGPKSLSHREHWPADTATRALTAQLETSIQAAQHTTSQQVTALQTQGTQLETLVHSLQTAIPQVRGRIETLEHTMHDTIDARTDRLETQSTAMQQELTQRFAALQTQLTRDRTTRAYLSIAALAVGVLTLGLWYSRAKWHAHTQEASCVGSCPWPLRSGTPGRANAVRMGSTQRQQQREANAPAQCNQMPMACCRGATDAWGSPWRAEAARCSPAEDKSSAGRYGPHGSAVLLPPPVPTPRRGAGRAPRHV